MKNKIIKTKNKFARTYYEYYLINSFQGKGDANNDSKRDVLVRKK